MKCELKTRNLTSLDFAQCRRAVVALLAALPDDFLGNQKEWVMTISNSPQKAEDAKAKVVGGLPPWITENPAGGFTINEKVLRRMMERPGVILSETPNSFVNRSNTMIQRMFRILFNKEMKRLKEAQFQVRTMMSDQTLSVAAIQASPAGKIVWPD